MNKKQFAPTNTNPSEVNVSDQKIATTSTATPVEYVGFWKRFLAYWIDGLIIGLITLPVSAAAISFNISSATTTHMATTNPAASIFGFIIGAAYFIFFWVNQKGQTLGNRLLAIRVQKEDGQPMDIGSAVIRYIGYLISSLIFALGFIWIAFDAKKQGWHDKMARTVVVKSDGKSHTGIAIAILAVTFLLFIILIVAIIVGGIFLLKYSKSHPIPANSNINNVLPIATPIEATPTTSADQSQQFNKLYMTSCNPNGNQTNFCTCTLQYLHQHYSNQDISNMGLQYAQTHQQPQGLQSAISACYSQIQK